MPQNETPEPSACDRVLAHYRERVGAAWRPADDILFRAAWNEGAHERERQLRDELAAANALLERARGYLGPQSTLTISRAALQTDIEAHLAKEAP